MGTTEMAERMSSSGQGGTLLRGGDFKPCSSE